jgi:DNA-binding response OmpR family regulator
MHPNTSSTMPQAFGQGSAVCLWVGGFEAAELHSAAERAALRMVGARDGRQALRMPLPDVLLVEAQLPDGDGLALAEELMRRSPSLPVLVASAAPGFEIARRALLLGALDILPRPLNTRELDAAFACALASRSESRGRARASADGHTWRLPAPAEAANRVLRDLLAHLVREGYGQSLRARVLSAAAELVDNARRHGAASDVTGAELHLRTLAGRLELVVRDSGPGFDPDRALLQPSGEQRVLGGLARAVALADEHRIESGETGSRVQLGFLTPAATRCADGGEVDWSEIDHLTPELARRVLTDLSRGDVSALALAPACAAVVARWVAPTAHRRLAQQVLWS